MAPFTKVSVAKTTLDSTCANCAVIPMSYVPPFDKIVNEVSVRNPNHSVLLFCEWLPSALSGLVLMAVTILDD
jgi:hypothetical protein